MISLSIYIEVFVVAYIGSKTYDILRYLTVILWFYVKDAEYQIELSLFTIIPKVKIVFPLADWYYIVVILKKYFRWVWGVVLENESIAETTLNNKPISSVISIFKRTNHTEGLSCVSGFFILLSIDHIIQSLPELADWISMP